MASDHLCRWIKGLTSRHCWKHTSSIPLLEVFFFHRVYHDHGSGLCLVMEVGGVWSWEWVVSGYGSRVYLVLGIGCVWLWEWAVSGYGSGMCMVMGVGCVWLWEWAGFDNNKSWVKAVHTKPDYMRRFCQQFLFKITHLLLFVCVCVCVWMLGGGGGGGTLACAVGVDHGRTMALGFRRVYRQAQMTQWQKYKLVFIQDQQASRINKERKPLSVWQGSQNRMAWQKPKCLSQSILVDWH